MADAERIQEWLSGLQRERQSKAGETTGVGDLLTLLGLRAAPGLTAAGLIDANSPAPKFRTEDGEDLDYELGYFPVFGAGKTGRLAAAHRRLRGNLTKELPMFSDTGLMAPARQRELEKRMREWIPQTSTKEPEHLDELLTKFTQERPGWGKVPVEKGGMTDKMHTKLRQSYYQALKEMGYGGIKYPEVRDYNPLKATGTTRPVEVLGGPARTWEEILQFEQKGNNPAGWEARFKALQELEAAAAKKKKPLVKTAGR